MSDIDELVTANRVLAQRGILEGFGHASVRDSRDPNRYFISRALAAALVTREDIVSLDLDSTPPRNDGRPLFSERFMHGEIYKARPDVNAIVHNHVPSVIPFSVTSIPLRPVHQLSAFVGFGVPVFDTRATAGDTDLLIRSPELARSLAEALGKQAAAILMRCHGATVVAKSLGGAVGRSVYLDMNAQIQMRAMDFGVDIAYLTPGEVEKAGHNEFGREWELWRSRVNGAQG